MKKLTILSLITTLITLSAMSTAADLKQEWKDIDLPLTQKQFCRVYKSNIDALNLAIESRNDIKINVALNNIEQDLISLLPGYQFENWVGKMSNVNQDKEGNVGVELNLQCNLSLASGTEDGNTAKRDTNITPDSRQYRELAKLNYGDYVLMSGNLIDFENGPTSENKSKYKNSSSFIVNISKISKY